MKKILSIFFLSIFCNVISCSTNSTISFVKDTNPIFLNESYYLGFQPIPNKGSMFFWLFESRNKPSEDPLLIWLNGGPGCSSEIAIFVENGPFRINAEENTLKINPYSWNNIANVLYVDNPLGAGYSTGNYAYKNQEEISSDFYIFLQEFLGAFPQYKGRDFYLAGEGYAGHYIPAIAVKIQKKGGINLNFKGVAIGNGLVSAFYQYPRYTTYALENKLIDGDTFLEIIHGFNICANLIKKGMISVALVQCQVQLEKITGTPPKFNLYDIRETCENPPFCYDFSFIENFLKQPKVQEALGIYKPWVMCNDTIRENLKFEMFDDFEDALSTVVQSEIQVLIYNGDKDFMYNWRGGDTMAYNLLWRGTSHFQKLPYMKYKNFGEYKYLDNLIYYRIYDAGMMVPMDQPAVALDMLEKFFKGWS